MGDARASVYRLKSAAGDGKREMPPTRHGDCPCHFHFVVYAENPSISQRRPPCQLKWLGAEKPLEREPFCGGEVWSNRSNGARRAVFSTWRFSQ
jgi:hypothetical protein